MSISKSLLQPEQAEEATKRADPSLKKTSPYSLGMVEWFSSDLYVNFQALKPKQRMLQSHGYRFVIVGEQEAETSAKKVVHRHTEKNDHWALNAFKACGQVSKTSVATEGIG